MLKFPPLPLLVLFFWPIFAVAADDRVAEATSGKAPGSGDLVLFPFDDISIPWRQDLKLTLQRPEKYSGNPVIKAGPIEGPDGYGAVLYGTVIKEEGKFRMWYLASPRGDSRIPGDVARMEYYRPVAYAESKDGIRWVRPNLGLVDFRGTKNNNLVLVEPADEPYAAAFDFIAVIDDQADPDPSRRYKMAYITYHQPSGHWPSTATAVSPDGIRWKLANTKSFTQGHFENTSLIRFHGLYYLAGQDHPPYDAGLADGSPAGRVMKVFFSGDFRHWSAGRALGFYRSDYIPKPMHHGRENHMGAGLWNRGNVVLGFYGRWHGDTIVTDPATPDSPLKGLKMDLGLVVSNDAIHYREPVRNFVMVPHGGPEQWDSEAILQANAFANTGTETYIWYSHWYTSRPDTIPPLPEALSAAMILKADSIGLLRLPRDRFGAFSKLLAVSQERRPEYDSKLEASCLTRSLTLPAPSRLFANVDGVSVESALPIALIDDYENPLEGYISVLNKNSLKAPVEWAEGKTVLPVNRPFRIKVTWPVDINNGKLYALYIERE